MANGKKVTPEQREIFYAYMENKDLSIEAGAGTGKTSTLRLLANAKPGTRITYFAFNRAARADASKSFPNWVTCKTSHGLAWGIGRRFEERMKAGILPWRQVAGVLGISGPTRINPEKVLAPAQLAQVVMHTVYRYCQSADEKIGRRHIPRRDGMDDEVSMANLAEAVLPFVGRAWDDLKRTDDMGGGKLRFTQDVYLKLWQLTQPRLAADVVMLDEAQDTNPVVWDVFKRQTHCQRILVGDRNQSIYQWRGSMNVMAMFEAQRLFLTQSFRFGPEIAAEANKWLEILKAELRLSGFDRLDSVLRPLGRQHPTQPEEEIEHPDAILCRSNAGAVAAVMEAQRNNKKVCLVGGGKEIHKLAEAAINLKAGIGTDHPELMAFSNWSEVQEYAEDEPAGSAIKTFVRMIDDNGPEALMDAMSRCRDDEAGVDLVVSTAHKAKGREWDAVKIAGDFREPREDQPVPQEDAMLAYVAVTRAKLVLDRGSLAWVDERLAKAAAAGEPEAPSTLPHVDPPLPGGLRRSNEPARGAVA